MVEVITTFSIGVTHEADRDHTRVLGTFAPMTDDMRAYLTRNFSAKWADDKFDIELQYARTLLSQLSAAERVELQIEPLDTRVPLALLIQAAVRHAQSCLLGSVAAVEILEERSSHLFHGQWDSLTLHTDCTVRVTQSVENAE